jgi:tetratricopeptide (TPR) repeat protein
MQSECGQREGPKRRSGTPVHGFVFIILIIFLLASLSFQAQTRKPSPSPADVSALLKTAQEALDHQDFETAAKALKIVVASQPDLVAAWFNLAYAESALHQDDDAVRDYQKAIALEPDLYPARLNLGILLVEAHRADAAAEQLGKAVELKPQDARAHLYYGRALSLAGKPDLAEKQFQEALRLDPAQAIAHYDVGQIELQQKRYEDARASFEKAAALDAKLSQAQLGLALALEGLNQTAQAAPRYEAYLAAKPDDLETRFHLARVYLNLGKNQEALDDLQKVYEASPAMPGVPAALGDVNALLNKLPESEKFYRLALVATPQEADLHRALGQTLLDEKKFPEAEAEFRASLKLDGSSAEAAKGLATSLYMQKHYSEAIPLIEALLRQPQPPAGLYFILATCYDDLKDRPKALENYEKFLDLSQGVLPDKEWQARQRAKLLRRELRK